MGHAASQRDITASVWGRCMPVTLYTPSRRIVTKGVPNRMSCLCPGPFAMLESSGTISSFFELGGSLSLALTTSDGVLLLRPSSCICPFEALSAWTTTRGPGIAAFVDYLAQPGTQQPCNHTHKTSHQPTALQELTPSCYITKSLGVCYTAAGNRYRLIPRTLTAQAHKDISCVTKSWTEEGKLNMDGAYHPSPHEVEENQG